MKELILISKEEIKDLFQNLLQSFFNGKILLEKDLNSENPELIFVDEASILTGLSKSTIYLKTSTNKIPHMKRGGKLYFKRSELLTWIEEGKI